MWRLVCRLWSSLITLTVSAVKALRRWWAWLFLLPEIFKNSFSLIEAAGPIVKGLAVDLTHNKQQLLLENALLRQQVIVLQRQVKRAVLQKLKEYAKVAQH